MTGEPVRHEPDPPRALAEWGWRFHHVGIPTTEPRPGEVHLADLGMHVSGFPTSPYGIEWMRFDPDSPVHPIIQQVPHIAFEVSDIDAALVGKQRLGEISSPAPGIRVAMILHDDAPVELIEFGPKARSAGP
jgi:hypothetical protein